MGSTLPVQGLVPTAAEVAARCYLSKEARQLLRADLTPRAFFDLLVEQGRHADALRFLAQALPKRLAVWWGCLCNWHTARPEPPESVAAALHVAVRWALEPTEANRLAAGEVGQKEDCETSAGCLAMAAFWSSGSLTPSHLPAVPVPPDLTGRLVSGAVLLAAVERDAMQFREHYRQFLALGLDVLQGKNLWPPGPGAPWFDLLTEDGSGEGLADGAAVPAREVANGSPDGHACAAAQEKVMGSVN
jgi:hypothetical protein